MKKTNFDRYLKQQMKDPAFATRFEQAGEAWDVTVQLAALREGTSDQEETSTPWSALTFQRFGRSRPVATAF
jgi:hypothetical protein